MKSVLKKYHPEAITSNKYFKHRYIRPLEKNQEYIVYLSYSEKHEGYTILDYESSVVSLNINENTASTYQSNISDMISLLSLDQSVSAKDLEALSSAKHLNKIIEFKNVSHKERDIKDFKLNYTIVENDDGTSVIEFRNHQYEITEKINSL